jgi:hypothetical protein
MRREEEGRMTTEEKQIKEMCAIMSNEVYMACEDTPLVHESSDICEYLDCRSCKQARLLINAGYRKQEWISVEERLPEECKNVLCFGRNKIVIAFMEKVEDCGEYVPVFWDWVAYDRDDTYDEICATHWITLPEAPKMRKEDEGK